MLIQNMRKALVYVIAVLSLLAPLALSLHPKPRCSKPNTTELTYRGDGEGLDQIYNALATCPNITSLDLDFTLTGCVIRGDAWAFQFQPDDSFPALQRLSL